MDLSRLVRVLARRWYLTLLLVAISALAIVAVVGTSPSGYKAAGPMVLLPPSTETAPGVKVPRVNPYMQLDGWQNIVAGLLATQLASDQFRTNVAARGVHGSWTVTQESGAPVLDLAVTDNTAHLAVSDATAIFAEAQNSLRGMQVSAGAPSDQLATLAFANVPTRGVAQYGHKIKVGGALAAVLLALSATIVFGVDVQLAKRSRRKRRTTSRSRRSNVRDVEPAALEESA